MNTAIHIVPGWLLDYKYYIVFATSFLFALVLIPAIISWCRKYELVDKPNSRKVHLISTPNLGGIAFIAAIILVGLLWKQFFPGGIFTYVLASAIMLFFVGIVDDVKGMRSHVKLIFQILAAVLVASGGLRLTNLNGFMGIHDLSLFFEYFLTVVVIVGVINAYNLVDGLDGLAGGIGFINFLILGFLFIYLNFTPFAILSFTLAGAILGFLRYNFNPASIFMGDNGSMIIGFFLATLGIKALDPVLVHHSPTMGFNLIIFVISIMILPVSDTIRVFIFRMIRRKSPFTPGKDHLHHILIKQGIRTKQAVLVLYLINILFILSGFIMTGMLGNWSFDVIQSANY